jgi:4-amino-4-deoxy-L-arabinose transferase-like glycosyltransferase
VFWTAYVLSETLFLLLLASSAWAALRLGEARRPLAAAVVVGVLGVLAIAMRPTGAAYLIVLFLVVLTIGRATPERLAPLLVGLALPIIVVAAIALPIQGAHIADWARSAVQNGLVETDVGRATSGVDLDVNPPPIVESLPVSERQEFVTDGPFLFAAHHPEFVAAQTLRKLRLFWTPILPEYSSAHAVTSSLFFLSFYVLGVIGFVRIRHIGPLIVLCAGSVLLFTLTSLVTIVDYDQRYRLPAELFLVPTAGVGLSWLIARVRMSGAPRLALDTFPPPAETSKMR